MNAGMLVLFPLAFASNVFVEPHTTPAWLQAFIGVNPVTHLVTASHELMAGTATWATYLGAGGARGADRSVRAAHHAALQPVSDRDAGRARPVGAAARADVTVGASRPPAAGGGSGDRPGYQ